jgi:hypothetical protein
MPRAGPEKAAGSFWCPTSRAAVPAGWRNSPPSAAPRCSSSTEAWQRSSRQGLFPQSRPFGSSRGVKVDILPCRPRNRSRAQPLCNRLRAPSSWTGTRREMAVRRIAAFFQPDPQGPNSGETYTGARYSERERRTGIARHRRVSSAVDPRPGADRKAARNRRATGTATHRHG